MSLDFFNQGMQGDSGIQYSKQQKQFFDSKLMLLDPKQTGQIELGRILWILSASNLRPDGRQKIMKNCKIQSGKKVFTYDQIRKVFRAIALLQNDIEPSAININANIRTKNPVFYDQDDSEDQRPPEKQPPPSQLAPQRQVPVPQQKKEQDFFQKPTQDTPRQLPSRTISNNVDMFANFQPKKQAPSRLAQQPRASSVAHNHTQKQSPLAIKMREFEVRWSKLKTDNNKIEGGQVKTLCKNLSQRTNLAKAWKLCCHTHSKALTKGEFFVFLELVANPNMPDHLTSDMKKCIALIDHSQKLSPANTKSAVEPPSSSTRMASSHIFENFGKSEVSAYEPPQPKPAPKREDRPDPHIAERVNHLQVHAQDISRQQQQMSEQTGDIRRNQQTMNNALGQLEQYLLKAKDHTAHFQTQFTQLRQNQNVLNERLNKACFFLSQIIKTQNHMIQNLANDYAQQNHMATQRIGGLEKYIAQMTQALQQKDAIIKQLTGRVQNNPQPAQTNQHQQTNQQQPPSREEHVQPQQQIHQVQQAQQRPSIASRPSKQHEAPSPPPRQDNLPPRQEEPQQPQHHQEHSPQPLSPSPQEREHVSEQAEHQQRIRSLQSQVFQLLRYIRQIVPGDEPKLVEYIKQLSEEQLNEVYIKCYQEFQARQKQEQMEAELAAKGRQSGEEDQFASSNFKGQPAPTQDMFD